MAQKKRAGRPSSSQIRQAWYLGITPDEGELDPELRQVERAIEELFVAPPQGGRRPPEQLLREQDFITADGGPKELLQWARVALRVAEIGPTDIMRAPLAYAPPSGYSPKQPTAALRPDLIRVAKRTIYWVAQLAVFLREANLRHLFTTNQDELGALHRAGRTEHPIRWCGWSGCAFTKAMAFANYRWQQWVDFLTTPRPNAETETSSEHALELWKERDIRVGPRPSPESAADREPSLPLRAIIVNSWRSLCPVDLPVDADGRQEPTRADFDEIEEAMLRQELALDQAQRAVPAATHPAQDTARSGNGGPRMTERQLARARARIKLFPATMIALADDDWKTFDKVIEHIVKLDLAHPPDKHPERRELLIRRLKSDIIAGKHAQYSPGYPDFTRIDEPWVDPRVGFTPVTALDGIAEKILAKRGSPHSRKRGSGKGRQHRTRNRNTANAPA